MSVDGCSNTLYASRALLGLFSWLQGPFATGNVVVRSTGATGTLPAQTFLVPVRTGQLDEGGCILVLRNPATQNGSWPVTAAGSTVPVAALQGGPAGNTPAGTAYRILPEMAGLEPVATSAAGLSGGAYTRVLKQVRYYRDSGTVERARALYNAQVTEYPAIVYSWVGDGPADGAISSHYGPSVTRPGRNKRVFRAAYVAHIVTSRLDSTDQRTRQGDVLRDQVLRLLTDRIAYRGLRVSGSPGIQLIGARLLELRETIYVDQVDFALSYTLSKDDSLPRDPEPSPWRTTELTVDGPGGLPTPDVTIDMGWPPP